MIKNFIEHSAFLCTHESIKNFVESYLKNYNFLEESSWSIVCERKEDIVTIRNQIFIELEKLTQNSVAIINGISIYTLDTIAQKICSLIYHVAHEKMKDEIPNSLFLPYLNITEQEKLVEIILVRFGYKGTDTLALAKQILTLIDVPLPSHMNLAELILATQTGQNKKLLPVLAEISLRQILATIQQAKIELSNYARFQTLVINYLNFNFLNHLSNIKFNHHFSQSFESLFSNVLWISAPEYQEKFSESQSIKSLKPGHFQSNIVNDFKNIFQKIHSQFMPTNFFYDSRTIISPNLGDKKINCDIFFAEHEHHFINTSQNLLTKKEEQKFTLLADIDFSSFQTTFTDGSGTYAITTKDLEKWRYASEKIDDKYFNEVKKQIDLKFQEFLNVFSYVQNEESLIKIGKIYSLKFLEINEDTLFELFKSSCLKEKIQVGSFELFHSAPKVLSFYNTKTKPTEINMIGRPHHGVSQSIHVKILNQVFFNLKQNGIEIEIPASETMYQLFWKNLNAEMENNNFYLSDLKDMDNFPSYLNINKISSLQGTPQIHNQPQIFLNQNDVHPNWKRNFNWSSSVSITQFEDYVHCPQRFYLKNLLKIKKSPSKNALDFRKIGTIMHKIGEQLITRLVTLFGNEGYLIEMPLVLDVIISSLQNETLFLSFEKEHWIKCFYEKMNSTPILYKNESFLAFEEAVHSIWSYPHSAFNNEEEVNLFLSLQEREILKRTFLKFLYTEKQNCLNKSKLKVGLYREFPIQFKLSNISFAGRIDRIDLSPEGLEIIDYKTSHVSKSPQEIVLLPSMAKENFKAKLSVQGAMYSYGFVQTQTHIQEENDEDYLLHRVKFYSLYYLKNINENLENCIKFEFNPELVKQNSQYISIEDEYKIFSNNLNEGLFYPLPLQGNQTCMYCDFKSACPKTYGK